MDTDTLTADIMGGARGRIAWIVGGLIAVAAAAIVVVALSGGGGSGADGEAAATPGAGDAAAPGPAIDEPDGPLDTSVENEAGDDAGSDAAPIDTAVDAADTPAAPAGQVAESARPEVQTEVDTPQVSVPALPADEGSEHLTCNSINALLREYRDLAAGSPVSALPQLQLALEEFDNMTDYLADGHEWGLAIVEQLVLVRRDWSTAYVADLEGDTATAEARSAAALGYLDAAIAVPCPES